MGPASGAEGPRAPGVVPEGDTWRLLAEMILKFPIEGFGQRNDQMKRVVASLAGRGFDDELITTVTMGWWAHFDALGLIGTPLDQAGREIRRTLASLARKLGTTRFPYVQTAEDHFAACRAIELADWQRSLLTSPVPAPDPDPSPPLPEKERDRTHRNPDIRRLSPPIQRLLCETPGEVRFVEALIVQAVHDLGRGEEHLAATNGQLRRLIAERHGEDVHPKVLEDLKRRYIARPSHGVAARREASRAELLRELSRGQRGVGGQTGTPSVFEPTGLLDLLPPELAEAYRDRRRASKPTTVAAG